jgi:CIC family chloride channel protein
MIIYTFAPEAEGHGTDAVIDAYHHNRGIIRRRVPLIKTIASAITIGTGGSAGREGPIAQIGAGFGSVFANYLSLSDRERRIMVICGAAAGIGSIFRAPLGGVLFALEVLYHRDLETEGIVPAFISSTVAYSVFTYFFGWGALFKTPDFVFSHPVELIFYGALGGICAYVGIIYVKTFYGMREKIFKPLKIKPHYKPALGGLILGIIAYFYPEVLSTGYGLIQGAIDGQLIIYTMLLLIILKILATSLTISSGGSGGVFAPTLVIGALLGGAFGAIAEQMFPELILQPTSYVLVGMAAMLAGVAKVPIAAIVMVSELTGSYHLLAPLMFASTAAYMLTGKNSIYEKQVPTRADSLAHRRELTLNVLETTTVGKAMSDEVITVAPENSVQLVLDLVHAYRHTGYPVVENRKLVGIVTFEDAEKVAVDERETLTVREIMTEKLITATPEETLEAAHRKLIEHKIGRLPVVSRDEPTKLLGILTRSDIIRMHAKLSSKQKP